MDQLYNGHPTNTAKVLQHLEHILDEHLVRNGIAKLQILLTLRDIRPNNSVPNSAGTKERELYMTAIDKMSQMNVIELERSELALQVLFAREIARSPRFFVYFHKLNGVTVNMHFQFLDGQMHGLICRR